MTAVAKYKKTPAEVKRYVIDYTDWLDTGETVTAMSFSVQNATTPPLVVASFAIAVDGKSVSYFVSGGLGGKDYEINIVATTSGVQTKEDCVLFSVRDC